MNRTIEARIRGEVQPSVWFCEDCGVESATWPGTGLPREWVRCCDYVLCKRCAKKRRNAKRNDGRAA